MLPLIKDLIHWLKVMLKRLIISVMNNYTRDKSHIAGRLARFIHSNDTNELTNSDKAPSFSNAQIASKSNRTHISHKLYNLIY